MTKLLEWIFAGSIYIAVWLALVTGQIKSSWIQEWHPVILFMPVITVIIFGICAAGLVVWRVYCFNDCPEAAKELQEQIKLAKEDLKSKGLDLSQ